MMRGKSSPSEHIINFKEGRNWKWPFLLKGDLERGVTFTLNERGENSPQIIISYQNNYFLPFVHIRVNNNIILH